METDASIEQMIFNATGMTDLILLLLRFSFNLLITWVIIHFLYYRRSGRRDYYFTFSLISIAIFFMIFMLGSIKLKIGFALGLFAIFGIIRYRTESMPVRERSRPEKPLGGGNPHSSGKTVQRLHRVSPLQQHNRCKKCG